MTFQSNFASDHNYSSAQGWPTGTPESQGFDSHLLADFVEDVRGQGVDSVLIVRNGVLIFDAYFYPYVGDRPHDVGSVTKSITWPHLKA